jgi:hypothetical protein|tara:strand:+ start:72 stop:680 length:609 start_codon:yes stop_codon:yes gene_type:complete
MLLYANGDSHTAPWSYVNIIGEELASKFVNQAQGGCSNAGIIRRTRNYLKHTTPDLVIIGWSTWEREEWKYKDQYYNVNSSGYDRLPDELQERYKQWVTKQTQKTLNKKSKYWHTEIYKLHQILERELIPHVFFNCMYNFFNARSHYPWNNCYIGPYDNDLSYYHWLKAQGATADEGYHYKTDGHQMWAKRVINYIKENKLL